MAGGFDDRWGPQPGGNSGTTDDAQPTVHTEPHTTTHTINVPAPTPGPLLGPPPVQPPAVSGWDTPPPAPANDPLEFDPERIVSRQ